jgi:hypothetical protein
MTRGQVLGRLLRNLVTNLFGGSTASALQHLMAETGVGRPTTMGISFSSPSS